MHGADDVLAIVEDDERWPVPELEGELPTGGRADRPTRPAWSAARPTASASATGASSTHHTPSRMGRGYTGGDGERRDGLPHPGRTGQGDQPLMGEQADTSVIRVVPSWPSSSQLERQVVWAQSRDCNGGYEERRPG